MMQYFFWKKNVCGCGPYFRDRNIHFRNEFESKLIFYMHFLLLMGFLFKLKMVILMTRYMEAFEIYDFLFLSQSKNVFLLSN